MNRVDRPAFFNDHTALTALSLNEAAGSHPHLQPHVTAIQAGYDQYVAVNGDVSAVAKVPLPPEIEAYLKGHYAQPCADISYIDTLRDEGRIRTCPMCGSLYGNTLDHVMPKSAYPCFAIFGLNLVPACQCNSLRTRLLVGGAPGARVLHPYFDDVLGERLLAARFEDLGPVPRVTVRVILDPAHPQFQAVEFHHANVVARTHAADWVAGEWTKFVLKPGNIVRVLRTNPATRADLVAILEEERGIVDEALGSRNNWQSIFLGGLLDDDVVDWLFAAFHQPGRGPNGPLV